VGVVQATRGDRPVHTAVRGGRHANVAVANHGRAREREIAGGYSFDRFAEGRLKGDVASVGELATWREAVDGGQRRSRRAGRDHNKRGARSGSRRQIAGLVHGRAGVYGNAERADAGHSTDGDDTRGTGAAVEAERAAGGAGG